MNRSLPDLLDEMECRLSEVDGLDEPARSSVFGLLDGVDALHRLALTRLASRLDRTVLERVGRQEPAVEWLFAAYGIGIDERAAAEAALESVRPYVESHGGSVDLVDVMAGRVRVRMAGACSGCTASAVTLTDGVEVALREGMPGFVAVEVEEEFGAEPHPPPRETRIELGRKSHGVGWPA